MSSRGYSLAQRVIETAKTRGVQLATAESLTAGLVGATLCDVPGASAVYRGGVISYSSDVKAGVLGVSAQLLKTQGAVDSEVVRSMAQGAARVCEADCAVATTGAAGPEPADGKPVGTVFIGIFCAGETYAYEKKYEGNRQEIRQATVEDVLAYLLAHLEKLSVGT
ncbi:CinA family protein [Rothia sp. ZJ1223]|uniref:CinA family protein n=1 Tax=Rothia sp. ZJ1223 TaxID=2811098 RepID=UPI00195C1821|nr:CinA family protein [Rothia sp. ZJ1223]MBM7051290.1 CinA family protein [Rothia sp. ZJ1223]